MHNRKFIVLGANGMLGRYVHQYLLQKGHEVFPLTRKDLDVTDVMKDQNSLYRLLEERVDPFDEFFSTAYVINCIGIINSKVEKSGARNSIIVNSVFPHILQEAVEQLYGNRLIHISTDCVYDGKKGRYSEIDEHTAKDIYGASKSAGEPEGAITIRTSIIGEEIGGGNSLLEWVRSNKSGECNGFRNHIWNGVTCLQLAKIIESQCLEDRWRQGITHVFSKEDIAKFDLVKMINEVYELNVKVNVANYIGDINRTLRTVRDPIEVPPLRQQIQEMKEFKLQ